MLTALGHDLAGRSFFDLWRAEGVDSPAVRIDPDRLTGLYVVMHCAGDTLCGSFLAEVAASGDARSAARYAACAAGLATTGYGAVPPIPRRAAVVASLSAHNA